MAEQSYHHPDEDFFRKVLDAPPPTISEHGTEEDVRANMKQLLPSSWRLEGNQLVGMTEMGELRQTIPTDHILIGTDDKGLPIFHRIVL